MNTEFASQYSIAITNIVCGVVSSTAILTMAYFRRNYVLRDAVPSRFDITTEGHEKTDLPEWKSSGFPR